VSAADVLAKGDYTNATIHLSSAISGTARMYYTKGGTWHLATRKIPVVDGIGSTTLEPRSNRQYKFVIGKRWSDVISVTSVAPAVAGTVADPFLVIGERTTATVTTDPAATGHARLWYTRDGEWHLAKRVIDVTDGVGTTTLEPHVDRDYKFQVGYYVSPVFSIHPRLATVPSSFAVTGAGWGHGVGMSQYGAYGMALDGYAAPDILTHYYTGTTVATVDANPDIRVQVFGSGADNRESVDLVVRSPGSDSVADGQWRMRFYDDPSESPTQTWYGINNEDLMVSRSNSTVTVTRENGDHASGSLVSLHWEGTSYYQSSSSESPFVELQTKEGGPNVTHGTYRHGRLLVTAINGRINVVNVLKLNTEYLYGIAEMPSSWAATALEAQAITARGYALRKVAAGKSAACGCNAYDDTRSQNFSGWNKENEGTDAYYGKRWVAAVDATSSSDGLTGQVLQTSSGAIATTYYFSSSGGQTENSEDVWMSTVSYLRSVADPWSLDSRVKNPNASWTANVSQDRAASAFGLSDIVSIKIISRTSSASTAAAQVLEAKSLSGATSRISGADSIRIKLGLKSPWVWSISAS